MTGGPGDIEDVKRALALAIAGPRFLQALSVVTLGNADGFVPLPSPHVYQEERLSTIYFPSCQIIGLRTVYPNATYETVKRAVHDIAVLWTAVAKDEFTVTRYVELLVHATTEMLWGGSLDMFEANAPIIVTEEDYSPLIPTRDHPYLKSGRVMLTVTTWRAE